MTKPETTTAPPTTTALIPPPAQPAPDRERRPRLQVSLDGAYHGPISRTVEDALDQIRCDLDALLWEHADDGDELVFRVVRVSRSDAEIDALPEWEGP